MRLVHLRIPAIGMRRGAKGAGAPLLALLATVGFSFARLSEGSFKTLLEVQKLTSAVLLSTADAHSIVSEVSTTAACGRCPAYSRGLARVLLPFCPDGRMDDARAPGLVPGDCADSRRERERISDFGWNTGNVRGYSGTNQLQLRPVSMRRG